MQALSSVVTSYSVRPAHRMIATFDPNDPRYSEQEHFAAINMQRAWAYTTGSPDVTIAVVDSGIDMTHPDLRRNQWINTGEICGNGRDDDNNGYVDDCEHDGLT